MLVKPVIRSFHTQRQSVQAAAIWVCGGALTSAAPWNPRYGRSGQQPAGCRSNTDAAAASHLLRHGRPGWECNPAGEWDASSLSQTSSEAPQGSVLLMRWARLLTLLESEM